jgi:DNA primase
MGADCSEKQAELIGSSVTESGRLWIMSDGDKAGIRHAQTIFTSVSPLRSVRWIKLAEAEQPTDLTTEQLASYRIT